MSWKWNLYKVKGESFMCINWLIEIGRKVAFSLRILLKECLILKTGHVPCTGASWCATNCDAVLLLSPCALVTNINEKVLKRQSLMSLPSLANSVNQPALDICLLRKVDYLAHSNPRPVQLVTDPWVIWMHACMHVVGLASFIATAC
jgi:hypothetical protein